MTTTSETATPSLSDTLVTGLSGIALVFFITFLCIAPFDAHFFVEWVGVAFMAATPAQVILGLLWHSSKPDFVGALAQPAKGAALTLITIAVGAIVMSLMYLLISGGHGMTPMWTHYAIMSIVVVIWVVGLLNLSGQISTHAIR